MEMCRDEVLATVLSLSYLLGAQSEKQKEGPGAPHTPVHRCRGRVSSAILWVMCPRFRAGFPSLGETRLHLVEVGLHFSYSGWTEDEYKSPLKCNNAMHQVLLVSWCIERSFSCVQLTTAIIAVDWDLLLDL